MGGVLAGKDIYDAFMTGPEHVIELFHGYTYSGIRWPARPRSPRSTYHEEGLIIERTHIDELFGKLAGVLRAVG
jgi:beta-alanine--pyruvate transaminase